MPRLCAIALGELLDLWKRELELQAWDIDLRICSVRTLRGQHGLVRVTEKKRQAIVWILDPREFNYLEMRPYDVEVTLVHELVHVAFPAFVGARSGDHRDISSEQAVHSVSRSLVRLKRAAFEESGRRWIFKRKPAQ